ncbi:unnamed protein product [Adineta ricciae]|uniref:Uncharacterized protein n=1 Tax=Adineta ricciae TaxID=249248 RepID=A0A814D9G5_ADIRI|nr:unnamed protein product [Adineta ricciae]
MIDNNTCFVMSMMCFHTLCNCCLAILGQYIYQYFLANYPNDDSRAWINITSLTSHIYESNQGTCMQNTTAENTTSAAEVWAQKRSADLIFQSTLWRAFPVIIVTYLFGLYASRLNRRLVLFLSLFGGALHVVICQAIIYRDLPEYWWYIASFIVGIAGGTNVVGIVLNLIITEITEDNERSSRFVAISAISTAVSAAATFGIGYYIQWRGYTDILWMAIGFEVLCMFSILFLPKSTHSSSPPPIADDTTSLLAPSSVDFNIKTVSSSKCSQYFDMCMIFSFRRHPPKKAISLIIIIVSYIFHTLASSSLAPLLWYLLGAPFCWTSKDLGYFSAISQIAIAVFSVLGMKILNVFGANDALICAFGHVSFFVYSLITALSKNTWQLCLSILALPFSIYQSSLTISMLSKLLEVHERHNVFALLTEINTIIACFGSSFFNWLYARTVTYEKNFTLLVGCGLCVVPFILNIYLYIINRRTDSEERLSVAEHVNVNSSTFSLPNNVLTQDADLPGSFLSSLSLNNSHCLSQNQNEITTRANSYPSTSERHAFA